MIKQYGADAVRWFILSDSPPEKTFNGQILASLPLTNFYKKFGI